MTITQYITLLIGSVVVLAGVLTIFFPSLSRLINAPGGPRLKAIVAIIIGLIILILGFIIEIPNN